MKALRIVGMGLALSLALLLGFEALDTRAENLAVIGSVVRHDADQTSSRSTPGEGPSGLVVPANLLELPEGVQSAVVVDLLDNSLFLIQNGQTPVKKGSYYVAIGKNGVDKMREGDEKTPVGVYFISSFLPDRALPEIYGAGAFPINYPNRWDRRLGRTGSGIWIHGSDKTDGELPPRSSRGCLTLVDPDFESLASYMQISQTPVIVANSVDWVSPAQIEGERQELRQAIENWRQDWESRDPDRYLRHYSTIFRSPDKTLEEWTNHKRRVNPSKRYIRIGISELGLYRYPGEEDLVLATYQQAYESDNFESAVRKHQYWRRENGSWRIVYEGGR